MEMQWKQQLEFVQAITDNVPIGICLCDSQGRVAFLNPVAERLIGCREADALGQNLHAIAHPEAEEHPCNLHSALDAAETQAFETVLSRGDEVLVVRGTASPFITSGFRLGTVLAFEDVTARRLAEEMLRVSEERYRSVVESSPSAITLLSLDGKVVTANQQAVDLCGLPGLDTIIGTNAFDFLAPEDRSRAMQNFRSTIATGVTRRNVEYTLLARDGRRIPILLSTGLIRDREGQPTACTVTVTDISEQKAAAEALRHMALHDQLTGLPNRTLFHDRLEQTTQRAIRVGANFALLMLDLDGFKQVNDTLGHHAGDCLLQEVAQRITTVLRQSDTVARLGGDEFAVLLPDTDMRGADYAAGKIHNALRSPICVGNTFRQIRASIGIAVYPANGTDPDRLLHHADLAMYEAKREQAAPICRSA